MNEAETRAEHIDPALKAAGWGVVEGSRILRETASRWAGCKGAASGPRPRSPITFSSTATPSWP